MENMHQQAGLVTCSGVFPGRNSSCPELDFADQGAAAPGVLYRLKHFEEETSNREVCRIMTSFHVTGQAFHAACCFLELDTLWAAWREDDVTPTCLLLEAETLLLSEAAA